MRLINAQAVVDELLKERRRYQMMDGSRYADAVISGINKALRIVEETQTENVKERNLNE